MYGNKNLEDFKEYLDAKPDALIKAYVVNWDRFGEGLGSSFIQHRGFLFQLHKLDFGETLGFLFSFSPWQPSPPASYPLRSAARKIFGMLLVGDFHLRLRALCM